MRLRRALAKVLEPAGGRTAETLVVRAVTDALLAWADDPSPTAAEMWARAAAQFDRALRAGARLTAEEWGDRALSLTRAGRFHDLDAMLTDGVRVTDDPAALIAVADDLTAAQRHDQALTVLDSVVERHSGDDGAEALRGRVLAAVGRPQEAAIAFDIAAFGHGLREDYIGALELIDEALSVAPSDAQLIASRGRTLVALGRLAEGIESLRAASQLRPDATTVLALAVALERAGDLDRALVEVDRALAMDASSAVAHATRARLLYRSGRLKEAVGPLVEAIAAEPNDALLRALLAELRLHLGQIEHALKEARAALEQDPALAHAWFIAARALRNLGDIDAAVEHASRAVAVETAPYVLVELGECLRLATRFDEARDALEQAIALVPDDAWALGTLGQVLAALGQTEEAISTLTRAADLDPAMSWISESLADALLGRGEAERANEAVTGALMAVDAETNASGRARLLMLQGEALRHLGRLEEAKEALAASLALKSDDPFTLGTMGQVLLALERPADAAAVLSQALKQAPTLDWVAANLVRALILTGHAAQAADHVAEAEARGSNRDRLFQGAYGLASADPDSRAALDAAIGRHSASAVLRLLRADSRSLDGPPVEALGDIEDALAEAPAWPPARLAQATVLHSLGRDQQAQDVLVQLVEEVPEWPEPKLQLASMLIAAGTLDDAASLLRPLVEERKDREAILLLADVLSHQNRELEALDLLRASIAEAPDPELLTCAAELAASLGESDEALRYAEAAAIAAPEDSRLHVLHGSMLLSAGQPLHALRAYEQACAVEPDDRDGLTGRGLILFKLDLSDDALQVVTRLANLYPDDVPGRVLLAAVHYMLEHGERAVTAFEEACQLDPDNYWSRRSSGDALFLAGKPDEGRALFRAMLNDLQERPAETPAEQHTLTGWALYRLGDHRRALVEVSRSVALDRRDADAQLDLALVTLAGSISPTRAVAEYGRGLELVTRQEGLMRASFLHAALIDLNVALRGSPRLGQQPETGIIVRKLEEKLEEARADVQRARCAVDAESDAIAHAAPPVGAA